MENAIENKEIDISEELRKNRIAFAIRIIATVFCLFVSLFCLMLFLEKPDLLVRWLPESLRFSKYLLIFILSGLAIGSYILFFRLCHTRAVVCGLNRSQSIIIFSVLAVIGFLAFGFLHLVILVIMLIVSAKTKNTTANDKEISEKL